MLSEDNRQTAGLYGIVLRSESLSIYIAHVRP
jgi:hypothetical protein